MRSILLALALLVGFVAPSRAAETQVTILTSTSSGAYYPLGMALSSIYGNAIKGVSFSAQATQASVENLRLLEAGDGELGFTLADTLASAVGNKDAGSDRLRGVAALYPGYVQLVANKESGIKNSRGSEGQARLARTGTIGHRGSMPPTILKAAGLTFGDLARVDHAPYAEGGRMVEKARSTRLLLTAGLGIEIVRHHSCLRQDNARADPARSGRENRQSRLRRRNHSRGHL